MASVSVETKIMGGEDQRFDDTNAWIKEDTILIVKIFENNSV